MLIEALVVVKLHHINIEFGIGGKTKPDPHLGQQAADKGQVILAVLHYLLAAWVLAGQREDKILTAHVMALTQNFFHNLRHRHVLIYPVLMAAR
ncbi:hypothetical protein YPPY36_1317, partial [Yersinia pestis PY-36]